MCHSFPVIQCAVNDMIIQFNLKERNTLRNLGDEKTHCFIYRSKLLHCKGTKSVMIYILNHFFILQNTTMWVLPNTNMCQFVSRNIQYSAFSCSIGHKNNYTVIFVCLSPFLSVPLSRTNALALALSLALSGGMQMKHCLYQLFVNPCAQQLKWERNKSTCFVSILYRMLQTCSLRVRIKYKVAL